MRKLLSIFLLFECILFLCTCARTGLKKYYTRISPEEFASYDSVVLIKKTKYGNIHHVFIHAAKNFTLEYLIFEKIVDGEKKGLFKMDAFTALKNDTTFILNDNPLKVTSDTYNWENGLWFYSYQKNNETLYSIDSVPRNKPKLNYSELTMGIYIYKNNTLVKLSGKQTEEEFSNLNPHGFIYLPNPGRFYQLANFSQIK